MTDIARCKTDFTYFCANCCKVHDRNHRNYIPFELYGYQKRFIEDLETHRLVIAEKRRQEGFTTLSATWLVWKCMFNIDRFDMILNGSYPMSVFTMEHMVAMIKMMPTDIQPRITVCDQRLIFEDTGSGIVSCTPDVARGRRITHLFIDEAAYIRDMEKHWKAIYPCFINSGSCHIISTPNGTDNWFHEMYDASANQRNDFHIWRKAWPTKAAKIDWKTEGF